MQTLTDNVPTDANVTATDGITFYRAELTAARTAISAYLGQGLAAVIPASLFLFHTTPKTIGGVTPNPYHVSSEKQLLALVDAEKVKQANSHAMDLFRAAKRLASHWINPAVGLPVGVSTANSTEAALVLLSDYFAALGVTSVEKLNGWIDAEQSETETFDPAKGKEKPDLSKRVSNAVKTAKRKHEFNATDAKAIAIATMGVMSFAELTAFANATAAKFAELTEIRRLKLVEKADKAATVAAEVVNAA